MYVHMQMSNVSHGGCGMQACKKREGKREESKTREKRARQEGRETMIFMKLTNVTGLWCRQCRHFDVTYVMK